MKKKKMRLYGEAWGIPKGYYAEAVPSKKGIALFAIKKLKKVC
jgi:hypothetical protein